jgi:hypothetical protein
LSQVKRLQGANTCKQPEPVPQRRRSPQDQPRGQDQLDVVVLMKMEREGE